MTTANPNPAKLLKKLRAKIDRMLSQHQHACEQVKEERTALILAEDEMVAAEEAQQVVQHLAQEIQQSAHAQIASVVSRCLEVVFEDPYEFRIEFERKRGRTEAKLIFVRDGMEAEPLSASGGGVVDVAAFALRLACIRLARPRTRLLVVMDEPFKFVHPKERRIKVSQMLMALAQEMGVQFIMVTGIDELRTGTVIEID